MAGQQRIEIVDGLRGVAALAVVLYHYVGYITLMGVSVGPAGAAVVTATRFGYLGVPIFFILSGYVIAMTSSRYVFTPGTAARFLLRRLVRLVPPYWVMVVLIAALLVAGRAAGFFRNTVVSPAQVVAHLGYLQNICRYPTLDVAYWTLCLEVQFYLVFAASAVAVRRLGTAWRAGWFLALTVASAALDVSGAAPEAWFPRWWYQFGVGVLTFYAVGERPARRMWLALLPALVALGLYRGHVPDVTVVAVAALLLRVSDESRVPISCPGPLLWLGRISYSLYLVHGFIGQMLAVVFRTLKLRSEPAAWLAIGLATASAIACATAFHFLVERRAIDWSRRVRIGPARRPTAPEALPDPIIPEFVSPVPAIKLGG